MSDHESGSRPEVSLPMDPLEDEAFPTLNPPVAKKRNKRSCGPTRHIDVALQSTTYVPRHSSPTHADLSSENHDQSSVFAIMYEHLRRDYRKARPTIYKVPKELKRGEEDEGYEPVAGRIGPFTKKNNSTTQLENYKWCCVRQLMIWRGDNPDSDADAVGLLMLWLESMERLEPEIRASYSEDIEPSRDGLALNMLLDGCFILHRLFKYARIAEREAQGSIAQDKKDDDWTQVFGRVWVWQLVEIDLLLLENQIPFLVLRELFELLCITDEPKDALVKGSLRLFRSLCPQMLRSSANSKIDYHGVHHLLHLFYLSITSPGPTPQPSESDSRHSSHQATDVLVLDLPQWIPCAKELEEAGVKFRMRKEAESFLDIKFDSRSGVLEIPPLQLYDFSDKLFRNLIAFEQTYPGTRCDITTYAVFMDCLINTPEDMRILHLRGILVNQINGEQDASRFFSRICAQVRWPADKNHLKNVMDKVNTYRGSKLHKWRAALVRNYFSNPWVAMSVLAAVLLLAMTILQTTFTVYPYFNPPE